MTDIGICTTCGADDVELDPESESCLGGCDTADKDEDEDMDDEVGEDEAA